MASRRCTYLRTWCILQHNNILPLVVALSHFGYLASLLALSYGSTFSRWEKFILLLLVFGLARHLAEKCQSKTFHMKRSALLIRWHFIYWRYLSAPRCMYVTYSNKYKSFSSISLMVHVKSADVNSFSFKQIEIYFSLSHLTRFSGVNAIWYCCKWLISLKSANINNIVFKFYVSKT